MSTQLPTSPDELSLLQIQAALTEFRMLLAERPTKLRELGQRLENFSDEIWQESASALRHDDPQASDRRSLCCCCKNRDLYRSSLYHHRLVWLAGVLSKLGGLELFSVKLPDLKGASLGSGAPKRCARSLPERVARRP
jgi:hypothetical protein